MRLLLLGGSSLVGAAIRSLPEWPADALWTYRSGDPPDDPCAVRLDLLDRQQVCRVVERAAPTHVLDTALPGREDPAAAAGAIRGLCDELRRQCPGVRYVLVSTDAVFSGEADRPYREDDPVDPGSKYGAAKAEVERVVRGSIESSCIARTSLVYGRDWRLPAPAPDPRTSDLIARFRAGQAVRQYARQYRTPTYLGDLAPALLRLAGADLTGILHLAGPVRWSRADFARQVAAAFGFDPRLVTDQPLPERLDFGADTSLDLGRAGPALGWSPHDTPAGLAHLAAALGR